MSALGYSVSDALPHTIASSSLSLSGACPLKPQSKSKKPNELQLLFFLSRKWIKVPAIQCKKSICNKSRLYKKRKKTTFPLLYFFLFSVEIQRKGGKLFWRGEITLAKVQMVWVEKTNKKHIVLIQNILPNIEYIMRMMNNPYKIHVILT